MFEVKLIELPDWNETLRAKAITYWQERRIVFTEVSEDVLIGRRGSLWWNLVTFDVSKLRTELTIKRLTQRNAIECVLHVNTFAQTFTSWDATYLRLEMETFEGFLLNGDLQAKKWDNFKQLARRAKRDYFLDRLLDGFWGCL
jgi:hypothetical protein